MMRLCQRESRNKEFYDHHERALKALRRIDEERDMIPERTLNRLNYAESEFHIVTSTYFYYVGLEKEAWRLSTKPTWMPSSKTPRNT